jgi:tetratricopeptide (TPR) repeat protein
MLFAPRLPTARAAQDPWEQLIQRAKQFEQQGNYAAAETTLLTALRVAEKLPAGDFRVATTLYDLGSIYQDLGSLAQAAKFYQRSLSVWQKALGTDHPSLARPLNSLMLRLQRAFRPTRVSKWLAPTLTASA